MIRFEDHDDFIEINLVSQETADLPSKGDGYLDVRVASAGFAGHSHLWVDKVHLRSFCTDLIALEENRRGQAAIESMSPGKLTLRIRSVNSRGHMCVEGSVGRPVRLMWHACHFGFEFDPSQLVKAVSTEWVRRNADAVVP